MTDAQKWLVFGSIVFTGWLLYLLAPVLTPFLISALLAYLGDPVVDRLEKLKISRTIAIVIVFAVMVFIGLVLLLIFIPLIQSQLTAFIKVFPEFINWIQDTMLPALGNIFGFDASVIDLDFLRNAIIGNWQDFGNVASKLLLKLSQSGQAIFTWLAYLLLIPVVTFYLLRDWDDIVIKVQNLIPRKQLKLVKKLVYDCDRVLSEFLRGQLLVMLALGIIYSIGLWFAGLDVALLIGMVAGLVSFVPYLGFIVGIITAFIAALIQFNDITHLIYITIVFGIGQAMEGMILSPLLVGDRIGLHPVAVIFAVMAGGQLFGFFGVLLALPVAAVIIVLLRYLRDRYVESSLYTP